MFLIKTKKLLRQLSQAAICYAFLFTFILVIILISRNQANKCSVSTETLAATVTESDWNFYETIEDEIILDKKKKKKKKIDNNDNIQIEECDFTIQLAIVCGGYNSTREFYILLKSILFFRTNPIELHLLVDEISHRILTQLFSTWQIPYLTINYYNASKYEREISWIPTRHYSNQFGLLKLVFPTLIYHTNQKYKNINNLIMLDTDMLFMGNVKTIWLKFDEMKRNNASIGLIENQSDWYLGKQNEISSSSSRLIWPAIGRGFNTGLLLFDLNRLKSVDWNQLWRQIAELELVTRLSTALADQDIFNAVSKIHSNLFYSLPLNFNIQLNDNANYHFTNNNNNQFQLIHWNSPNKLETSNKMANNFRDWYKTFINWDANLLKQQIVCSGKEEAATLFPLDKSQKNSTIENIEESCNEIRPRPMDKLRTYLYYIEMENSISTNDDGRVPIDITIVVHLSVDRLRALDELAAHWSGPISVAIYLAESETSLFLDSIKDSDYLSKRKNVGYHLVFRDYGFNYPINRLRNIALNQVETEYVFLTDVDFLPSYNLYEYLKSTLNSINQNGDYNNDEKIAYVVPAFESLQYKFEFPLDKSELEKKLSLGSISMFREQIWPRGHLQTDYSHWRKSKKAYKVLWQPDYEPFIVTKRDVVRFDERFVGFGWNKVEHIMQLAAMNYQFYVLPEVFLIHQFHPASYDILKHRQSKKYRTCIRQLKMIFTNELVNKFPDFFKKVQKH